MSIYTELHTFEVREIPYKICIAKEEEHEFVLLNDSNLVVTNIYGNISTCFTPHQLRFTYGGPLWKYSPIDRIAIEDTIAYLHNKYNNQN